MTSLHAILHGQVSRERMEIALMKTTRALVLLALAAMLPAAHAQTGKWPERPVRTVVPFAPGGATDVVARMMAPRLAEEFGQQFVIDNRAGAGGSIGVEIVVRANPDGYTILVGASSYASNVPLYKLPYDPITGISPVTLITQGPFIVAVHPSVKANSVKELIALARAKPGSLSFGSSGTGSVPHLATEQIRQMANINMVHVPYKGDAPAIIDLLGGQIQIYFGGPLVLSPHMNVGKLRGLAVTSEQRSPVMPDLPAVNELVPGYTAFTWFGMWAPPGTPKAIIAQLNQSVARILKKPEVQERLRNDGMEAAHNTPEEFSRFIARDIAKWTKVVQAGNIKVD
jgi:tripartite-type tricarboxylate transporter receptor subunit TctC